MAVVRCPRHDIPYNDANPRGCPACWRERQGEDEPARAMRELARISRGVPAVEVLPPEEAEPVEVVTGEWGPVTTPPRVPMPEPTRLERALAVLRENRLAAVGIALGIVGIWLIWFLSRPTFVEEYVPPRTASDPRPFPVEPNTPIIGVFALLGTVPPQPAPEAPTLARHDFGGVLVDALNGVVYAVTLVSPERTWRGHRVGLTEQTARGLLALQGEIREQPTPAGSPFPLGGFLAYRSVEALPLRVLAAEVRPPNGCYDVRVEIGPQVIGLAKRGDEAFVAVARRGGTLTWVVHRVQVVSRAMDGPYGGAAVC